MDSIWVSEAYDPGSIPGRATFKSPFSLFSSKFNKKLEILNILYICTVET